MSVRVLVPYLPLEKLGVRPSCHRSCAYPTPGAAPSHNIVHNTYVVAAFEMFP